MYFPKARAFDLIGWDPRQRIASKIGGLDVVPNGRRQREIGRHDDLGGLVVAPRLGDQPLHFDHAIFRRYDRVTAGCLSRYVDEIAENSIAKGMMRDLVQPLILIRRHPDQMEDERSLGFGAHHAVKRRHFAHGIGCHQQSGATNASVSVGGVSGVQLIRAAYPFDFRAAINCVA